jgi:hypothetical protein
MDIQELCYQDFLYILTDARNKNGRVDGGIPLMSEYYDLIAVIAKIRKYMKDNEIADPKWSELLDKYNEFRLQLADSLSDIKHSDLTVSPIDTSIDPSSVRLRSMLGAFSELSTLVNARDVSNLPDISKRLKEECRGNMATEDSEICEEIIESMEKIGGYVDGIMKDEQRGKPIDVMLREAMSAAFTEEQIGEFTSLSIGDIMSDGELKIMLDSIRRVIGIGDITPESMEELCNALKGMQSVQKE